ncbi:carbamoyl phosphate synthase large subunit [bacterium CG_4_9_14_3_um_filter_65_15]|nr:MAG: carbamoyl phosphate synthase large subunit [bacterium CG_4_9_14_3_um_filter_65_15]
MKPQGKRTDIGSILVLGSGPIVIGQACEFDYSGTQAVKALRREGYRVILVNSNPATVMTDPGLADVTYIEPLDVPTLEDIIARERPDALLPTVGGQTGLNLAVDLAEAGVLERYGVELIGASVECVRLAEDRLLFKETMAGIGLETPRSLLVRSMAMVEEVLETIPFPMILRASFTLGGAGSGVAHDRRELESILRSGLAVSPVGSVLVEESVLGWQEFELEVIRDRVGNGIVVCSIENVDPMGVHTGDSITVAPAQTLTDRQYQELRNMALRVLDAVGVVTGGSNVQFAVDPLSGRVLVIEMNPRVSRSSALASKATGYPIAKVAAMLAVGYTLPELPNEITGTGSACFEPSIDYVVVKIPRWSFEKFPGTPPTLGTAMQSVGEAMALGRTFRDALQKALRSLDTGLLGWSSRPGERSDADLEADLRIPGPERLLDVHEAMSRGWPLERLHEVTNINPWFLDNLRRLHELERRLEGQSLQDLPADLLREAKREGFGDAQLATLLKTDAAAVRTRRRELALQPVFRRVDTCAAEFRSGTPYLYSVWEEGPCEAEPSDRAKVIVLGGGPNRIGQGIEFDTCCCHAVQTLRAEGREAILINCNPETVSTDYDLSDRLYFEPLDLEEVLHVVQTERPDGVIVTLGGQTPLNLAQKLEDAGVALLGTGTTAIARAEDRELCRRMLDALGVRYPRAGCAETADQAGRIAAGIGYPVMVRPSFVLGGRAMQVAYAPEDLEAVFTTAAASGAGGPVLIDAFLEGAVEFDVDAVSDGRDVLIGGILQHIEAAGIHSGDSYAVLPPHDTAPEVLAEMRSVTRAVACELGVIGLLNIQFALHEGDLFVLEINPRASRTVPFLEKASGADLTATAVRCMLGRSLAEQKVLEADTAGLVCVKAPVFPFRRFPRTDHLLGPEMKSTGEVMGRGAGFGEAFARAQAACGQALPRRGTVFVSVRDQDKPAAARVAADLADLGFRILATGGTRDYLAARGIDAVGVEKVGQGEPHIGEVIATGGVQMVINTPLGRRSRYDEGAIRREARALDIPCITTMPGARAAVEGIRALGGGETATRPLVQRSGAQ